MSEITDKVGFTNYVMHTVEEMEFLEEVARVSVGRIANLGCHRGVSAAVMALASEHPVYSVDLYTWDSVSPGCLTPCNAEIARNLWADLGVDHKIKQCVGSTDEWAVKLADTKFGFLFIDADHGYWSCHNDFVNWSPMVVPGGLIGFHDCDQKKVNKVVAESIRLGCKLAGEVGRIKIVEKPQISAND